MGMRVSRRVVGRSRFGFIAALVLGCPSLGAAQDSAEDERAIRRAIVQTTEAFNAHDASAFARFYTADADLVTVRGEVMKGSAAIERWLASIFATRARSVTVRQIEITVRFIKPDVAVAHMTNELSGMIDAQGQSLPPHRELSVRVFVKTAGAWRVTAAHNTMVAAVDATDAKEVTDLVNGATAPSNNAGADEVRSSTMAALAADLGVGRTSDNRMTPLTRLADGSGTCFTARTRRRHRRRPWRPPIKGTTSSSVTTQQAAGFGRSLRSIPEDTSTCIVSDGTSLAGRRAVLRRGCRPGAVQPSATLLNARALWQQRRYGTLRSRMAAPSNNKMQTKLGQAMELRC